jgi:hypothetical protein
MELTPQSEYSFRDPTLEMARVMQLRMTPDATSPRFASTVVVVSALRWLGP